MSKSAPTFTATPNRRQFIAALSVAAAGLRPRSAVAQAREVDLVRVRVRSDPFPFDPARDFRVENEFILRSVYAPLTRQSGRGWKPFLASEVIEDHTVDQSGNNVWRILIRLRSEGTWSGPDIRMINAHDVSATILRLRDAGIKVWQDVKDVVVHDDLALRLILNRKNVTLWRNAFPRAVGSITAGGMEIVNENTMRGEASGPYFVAEMHRELKTVLVRRNDWSGDRPSVKRAEFHVVRDTEVALAMFRAGELDIVNISVEMAGSKAQRHFEEFSESFIEDRSGGQVIYVGIDVTGENTEQQTVRKAVQAAIDPDAVARAGFGERGADRAFGVVPRQFAGGLAELPPDVPTDRDLETAKRLLSEAGLGDGFSTELWVPPWLGEIGARMAENIRTQLLEVGILAQPVLVDAESFLFDFRSRRGLYLDSTSPSWDASTSLENFVSNDQFNLTQFNDPEYDALFAQSLNATEEERIIWHEKMQLLLSQAAVTLPIAQPKVHWLVRRDTIVPDFAPDGLLGDLADFQAAG